MAQDIIDTVKLLGKEEGVPDGIQFLDVNGKATVLDLYLADTNNDDSCASDKHYQARRG